MQTDPRPAEPHETNLKLTLRPGHPDFLDLPWDLSLGHWAGHCARLEEVTRGVSRHPVVFVNYSGGLYALKELSPDLAAKEYQLLVQMEELRLPVVNPVGFVSTHTSAGERSVLITRYLDRSLPYRSLFMRSRLEQFRDHLLNAIAGLLVQLHLAGVYWGDCSLSNTLFRRDAGALQAYLVDAETAEVYPPRLSPTLRHHDLEIMESNIDGDLNDLAANRFLTANVSILDTGEHIRQRYHRLWEEITREQILNPDERYRIQERIRALNNLGFAVRDVEMHATDVGDKLRFRVMVTDRNFHRDQLLGLTGLEAEEMQARQMMNEIQEVKATLSQAINRSTPLSAAAFHWLEHIYQPVMKQIEPILSQEDYIDEKISSGEVYCQILENKWYLSERAQHDVGHQAAVEDYIRRFRKDRSPGSQNGDLADPLERSAS